MERGPLRNFEDDDVDGVHSDVSVMHSDQVNWDKDALKKEQLKEFEIYDSVVDEPDEIVKPLKGYCINLVEMSKLLQKNVKSRSKSWYLLFFENSYCLLPRRIIYQVILELRRRWIG